ncbi:hypothetical protein QTG54_008330 [Skeletonema marinoi]|uniref:Uncharacterized protein n=1 Tax=Skeletonema marinoi TaxID=267567 RepID=A0AAD8Y8D3_9STRA|nr:hypothetical protein QTG54_008330 [Skeletonema marinoi]
MNSMWMGLLIQLNGIMTLEMAVIKESVVGGTTSFNITPISK